MNLVFAPLAWSDYLTWQEQDKAIAKRINDLIRDTRGSPFVGIGKPEPLREDLKGWWSRRITGEHRLVYRIKGTGDEQALEVASCHFHYRGR